MLVCTLSLSANEANVKSDMLGLRTAVYMVDNIDKAKDWYSKAFGVAPYFDEAYYVGFNIRGFELGLMPVKTAPTGSGVVSYWGVEDVDATYKKLLSLGAKPVNPVIDVGGGIRLGVVADPFGNPLGIIYNPLFNNE